MIENILILVSLVKWAQVYRFNVRKIVCRVKQLRNYGMSCAEVSVCACATNKKAPRYYYREAFLNLTKVYLS